MTEPDKDSTPGTKGTKSAPATSDKSPSGEPVGMESMAKMLDSFKTDLTKQIQGIRQFVNQRDEAVRQTLETLASEPKGRRGQDRLELDDLDDDDDDPKPRGKLRRYFDERIQSLERRDDAILQGQAVTQFLVDGTDDDDIKRRRTALPRIEELLKDPRTGPTLVHRNEGGLADYRMTLERAYERLQLAELRDARQEAEKEKTKLEAERRKQVGAAVISGDGSGTDLEVIDLTGKSSDDMLKEGLIEIDPRDPPTALANKEN